MARRVPHPVVLLSALTQVRVAVEEEVLEPLVHHTLLVGDVDEPASTVVFQVPPALLAAEIAVHQTQRSAGFQDFGDLVEGLQGDVVVRPCDVRDSFGEVHRRDVPLAEGVLQDLDFVAANAVAVLDVAAAEHVTGEGPRVVVGHRRAVTAQVCPDPVVQLDGLEVGLAAHEDRLGLVEGHVRVFDVRNTRPLPGVDEPLVSEVAHQFGHVRLQALQGQAVELLVENESLGDHGSFHLASLRLTSRTNNIL